MMMMTTILDVPKRSHSDLKELTMDTDEMKCTMGREEKRYGV
jgi:hypothetical protein